MIDVNLKLAFDVSLAKSKHKSVLAFCNANDIPRSKIRSLQEGSSQIKWSTLNAVAGGFEIDIFTFLKNGVEDGATK